MVTPLAELVSHHSFDVRGCKMTKWILGILLLILACLLYYKGKHTKFDERSDVEQDVQKVADGWLLTGILLFSFFGIAAIWGGVTALIKASSFSPIYGRVLAGFLLLAGFGALRNSFLCTKEARRRKNL